MMPDIVHAEFNDLESVKALVNDRVCAILVEPVQGEGGIIPAETEFLQGLKSLCDEENILLIFDEVQCGMGRLGTPFAFQKYGVVPDAVSLAKGLGAGVPVGALVIGSRAADVFVPGDHASTFGGNFLAGAAASCMTAKLANTEFMRHINTAAEQLSFRLTKMGKQFPNLIRDVRGIGLMMGIELTLPAKAVIESCMNRGLLLIGAGTHVIRFVPPLIVSPAEIDKAVDILEEVLSSY